MTDRPDDDPADPGATANAGAPDADAKDGDDGTTATTATNAGDRGDDADGRDRNDAADASGWVRRERSFRGISRRLAVRYLSNLGGDPSGTADDRVEGDDWTATLSEDTVSVGPSLTLTEVTVAFEGDPETLGPLIDAFAQKAMRAGG
jgi:hypothetical protein